MLDFINIWDHDVVAQGRGNQTSPYKFSCVPPWHGRTTNHFSSAHLFHPEQGVLQDTLKIGLKIPKGSLRTSKALFRFLAACKACYSHRSSSCGLTFHAQQLCWSALLAFLLLVVLFLAKKAKEIWYHKTSTVSHIFRKIQWIFQLSNLPHVDVPSFGHIGWAQKLHTPHPSPSSAAAR